MPQVQGSCLCGGVTYRADAEPLFTAACHCTNCQKQTGTSFSVVVGVPADAFHVEGDSLSSFTTIGDDHGQEVDRRFCRNCGSPVVTYSPGAAPGLAIVKAGTLDDTSWLEPALHIWTESAQPWVMTGEAARLPRGVQAPA
jgi:hypothetical protein